MELFQVVKSIHFLSAIILINTRFGLILCLLPYCGANFGHRRSLSLNKLIAIESLFVAPFWFLQLLSGLALIYLASYDWGAGWLLTSYGIYSAVILLSVATIKILKRADKLVSSSAGTHSRAPKNCFSLATVAIFLSGLSSAAILSIFWLMLAKS